MMLALSVFGVLGGARVSLETQLGPIKAVLAEFARTAEVELAVDPAVHARYLQLTVRNRPFQEVMDQIAAATLGQWAPSGGSGWVLVQQTPTENANKVLLRRQLLDTWARGPVDGLDFPYKREPLKARYETYLALGRTLSSAPKPPYNQMEQMESIERLSPFSRAMARCWQQIDLDSVGRAKPGTRIEFSSHPSPHQRKLRQADAILRELVAERRLHDELAGEILEPPSKTKSRPPRTSFGLLESKLPYPEKLDRLMLAVDLAQSGIAVHFLVGSSESGKALSLVSHASMPFAARRTPASTRPSARIELPTSSPNEEDFTDEQLDIVRMGIQALGTDSERSLVVALPGRFERSLGPYSFGRTTVRSDHGAWTTVALIRPPLAQLAPPDHAIYQTLIAKASSLREILRATAGREELLPPGLAHESNFGSHDPWIPNVATWRNLAASLTDGQLSSLARSASLPYTSLTANQQRLVMATLLGPQQRDGQRGITQTSLSTPASLLGKELPQAGTISGRYEHGSHLLITDGKSPHIHNAVNLESGAVLSPQDSVGPLDRMSFTLAKREELNLRLSVTESQFVEAKFRTPFYREAKTRTWKELPLDQQKLLMKVVIQ